MKQLKIQNINYAYQDGNQNRSILQNLSYTFTTGKMYAIVGQSGSGKTTLISLMSGLDKIQSGQITVEEKQISQIGYEKYRSKYVSMVFQSYHLIKYMTAVENVLVAMGISRIERNKVKARAIAVKLLADLGIDESKINRRITELSGGEQQRVAIARALSTQTDFIFADEPTGNLDEQTQKEIISILQNLAHEQQKCVIVVTHAPEIAAVADVTLKLEHQKLQEEKV